MLTLKPKHRIQKIIAALASVIGLFLIFSLANPIINSDSQNVVNTHESTSNFELIPGAYASNSTDLSKGGSGLTIPTGGTQISNAISKKSFGATVIAMVNYFIGFLGFLATLTLVYAGVLWVVSAGNEELTTKAKKIITYAALGLVVVILSYSAVVFITKSAYKAGGPSIDSGTTASCVADTDCSSGQSCVSGKCINSGTGIQKDAVKGTPSKPAFDSNLDKLDKLTNTLESDLKITNLSEKSKTKVNNAMKGGDLTQKINNLKKLDTTSMTTSEIQVIQKVTDALSNMKSLRKELSQLYKTMPKSKATEEAYKEASDDLDKLIKNPIDRVQATRFVSKYKKLKELIKKFPVVKANILAYPGGGSVPFTVQFDGLNSIDPTGGTISNYNWSYLDSNGNEVSLGSKPVILHTFSQVNTYAVRLRVSTSNTDKDGYKTAADGTSIVRIKANPPTSKVFFRINGTDAQSMHSVTLKEARGGISFDPSSTTAAQGRKIVKYKWDFGDTFEETRLVPSTVIHNYPKIGEYNVTLYVTDNIGITDKKVVKLVIKSLAADIKVAPSTGNVNTGFRFTGAGSRSDNGLITNYDWNIIDSKGQSLNKNNNKTFTYRFEKPGSYQVILLATDTKGAIDKVIKDVKIVSRKPIASFKYSTPKQNHPSKIKFDAIDSYDPDKGDSLTYSWDFDGDGHFDVVDSKKVSEVYLYNQIGDYKVKLQIQDEFGKLSQIEKKVSIKSLLSADIYAGTLTTRVGTPISLSVKNSNAVAYLWEFGDGKKVSTEKSTVNHTYNQTGKFNVKLTFFDKDNNSNYDKLRVLVGKNNSPIASINYTVNGLEIHSIEDLCGTGRDGVVVSRSDKLTFSAKNSLNTDGTSKMLAYDWKFPGGEKSSYKETQFKFFELSKEGECFSSSLYVRDQLTGKLSAKDLVYFKVINKLPKVTDFSITPPENAKSAVTPVKVKLSVINASDSDGTVKQFKWWYYLDGYPSQKFGIHSTTKKDTTMTITSYGKTGTTNRYHFVVEVIDNDGGKYSSKEHFGLTSYLDVKNGKNTAPIAEFTMDKTTISVGESITFVSKSYDPQGETLPSKAYLWDFDGDGDYDDTTTGAQVSHKYNTPGQYTVLLKMLHRGLSASKVRTIYVETTESYPHAAFTYSTNGNSVTFNGSHSTSDPKIKTTALKYSWDFNANDDADGNGTKDDDVQSTKNKPSFTYSYKGVYKVRLQVTDAIGNKGVLVRFINLNLTDEQRKKDAYKSPRVSSLKQALTTVDVEVTPKVPVRGGTAEIKVRVLNADSSPYNGRVYFGILEGSGSFTPNPVRALNSEALGIFKASDAGKIRIQVRASGTVYGDVKEDFVINVK